MANKLTQMAFLRNGTLYNSKKEAKDGLKEAIKKNCQDGSMILARYFDKTDNEVKSLIGIVYSNCGPTTITIFKSDEVVIDDLKSENTNKTSGLYYGEMYENYLHEHSKTKPNQ